jgi:hypothetical protein
MRPSIEQRRVCGVWAVDEFNFMPMLNNLFFASDAAEPRDDPRCERGRAIPRELSQRDRRDSACRSPGRANG